MMDHRRAPLYEALVRLKGNHVSFHVPGHKDGQDFDFAALRHFAAILTLDQTEIEGLDDLHHPSGVIAEAEKLAADAFGSEETKFLVGGTTAGILALILATVGRGEKILIQRDSHKSVFHGIKIAGAVPVFAYPEIDPVSSVPKGVSPNQIARLLAEVPGIRAVLITAPNYYGQAADIEEIADVVHRHHLPLFVDEAHGAHFAFHPELPRTALEQGADAVVQSIHKTLPAMTMASMLHFQGNRVNRRLVKRWLSMLQSSSPSYPLMASLDLARRHMMVGKGKENLDRAIQDARRLRNQLTSLDWLRLVPADDPLRLVFHVHPRIMPRLQSHLKRAGIYPELIEANRMVFVATGGNRSPDFEKLWYAFSTFAPGAIPLPEQEVPNIPEHLWALFRVDSVASLDEGDGEWVELEKAAGRIAGEMVIPYPPGIPLIMEGQRITEEMVQVIRTLVEQGIHVQGIQDGRLWVIHTPKKGG